MSKGISETAFASQVEDLLEIYHWLWMHIRPARVRRGGRDVYETPYSGHKGWLDYLALRPPRIVVFELKDAYKQMTPEQEEWFKAWEDCQRTVIFEPLRVKGSTAALSCLKGLPIGTMPEVYLFRPLDIERVVEVLK